jgi:hypothetical protein
MNAMRRRAGEMLLSAFGLLLLVSVLVVFDSRVRDRVSTIVAGNNASANAESVTAVAGELGSALFDSAREQSREHAPLLVFGTAAIVLVTFMLRT